MKADIGHLPNNATWPARTGNIRRPPIAQVTARAAQLREEGRDIIDLGQAVLNIPPPPQATRAMKQFVGSGRSHLYAPDPGLPALREALADHMVMRKAAPSASAEHVMVTCGANQAYANALLTVTQPGDEVITLAPGYFDHGYAIRMAGCWEIEAKLGVEGDRFTFDLDAIEGAISPRTRCVTLVSPGNPTGAVADQRFISELAEVCKARGIWIISDETYDMLTFTKWGHVSAAAAADYERVIVLSTFSKSFAMAAWRVGYLFAHPDVIGEAFKVQDALVVCAPVPGQVGVTAGLGALDEHLLMTVEPELRKRRDALLDGLRGSKQVQVMIPDGATFAMARLLMAEDDEAFSRQLLEDAGLVVVPGSAFGQAGRGYVRMSFGNQPVDRIAEAAGRLKHLLG